MLDPLICDVGSGTWPDDPQNSWVTKTDLIQYSRCAYKVSLSHKLGIRYQDFLTESAKEKFLRLGNRREQEIVEDPPSGITIEETENVKEAVQQEGYVRSQQLIRNHDIGYLGRLDLIVAHDGNLFPVEIKNHKKVNSKDKLELAFYWRLLEPLQVSEVSPVGFVLLNDDTLREVNLRDRDFLYLDHLVSEIRRVRVEGTAPFIVAECEHCVFKEEHEQMVRDGWDLSLVRDIGSSRRTKLKELGVNSVGELAESKPSDLWKRWTRTDRYAPPFQLFRDMQAHATALMTGRPQKIGEGGFKFADRCIVLDLEYESGQNIFLIGVGLHTQGKKLQVEQRLTERGQDEQEILIWMCKFFIKFPQIPIVTWSGLSAEAPQLKRAWKRCNLPDTLLDEFLDRHIDAYQVASNNVRLPVTNSKLDQVASYFGHRRRFKSLSGLDIPFLYEDYLTTDSQSTRDQIREKILRHNKDDVIALARILDGLKQIAES